MKRGTTPTLHCSVTGADLSGTKIYATLRQGDQEITVLDPECETTEEGCSVTFTLTQEQTLKLKNGRVSVQLRWVDRTGAAAATPTTTISVDKILKEGEITYE